MKFIKVTELTVNTISSNAPAQESHSKFSFTNQKDEYRETHKIVTSHWA
jgi:hypothetical protein